MTDDVFADFDLQEYLQVFIADAKENFAQMEEHLLSLEDDPHNTESIGAIFRSAHTIKGNANLIGFRDLADFAHTLENILDLLRNGKRQVTRPLISVMLNSVDAMRAHTRALAESGEAVFEVDAALLTRLQTVLERDDAVAEAEPASTYENPLVKPQDQSARTMRVPVDRLDLILNLTSEITISRGRERTLLQAGLTSDANEAHHEAERLYTQLRDEVAKLRLVPIGPVFRRLRRLIRDVAHERDKKVAVQFEGEDVELDTSMIEQLNDPMLHMARNAVDHGLETCSERLACGKAEQGTIHLRALYEKGNVVILMTDDGRGLSRERILKRALERGLISAGEQRTDAEINALIFEPGFSTAENITDLSGRGVGLDVVKRNVEALRGTISVTSTAGSGTTFSIRVPLTVATIDGFNVEAGGETYVLPLDYVVECVELPKVNGAADNRSVGLLNLRGDPLPFIRLARLFERDTAFADRESAVIVQSGDVRMALVVETLRGEAEAVIKPLGRLLGSVPGLSGSTILGSGRIGLIVDVPALLQRACTTGASTHV